MTSDPTTPGLCRWKEWQAMAMTSEEQRAARRAYMRRWRLAHPGYNRQYSRAWNAAHPEYLSKYMRVYRKAWNAAHPEKVHIYRETWNAAHRAEIVENMRRYNRVVRFSVPEASAHARARTAQWTLANPERAAARREANNSRRRARLAGAGGFHSPQEWRDKLTLFAGCCIYCGEAKPLTVDHKIPIARGGTDDISNIVPACMECNLRKGTRTASEFLALRKAA